MTTWQGDVEIVRRWAYDHTNIIAGQGALDRLSARLTRQEEALRGIRHHEEATFEDDPGGEATKHFSHALAWCGHAARAALADEEAG